MPGVLVIELPPPIPRPLPRPAPFGGGDFGLNVSMSSVLGMTGWSTKNSVYFSLLWLLLDNSGPNVSQPVVNIFTIYMCNLVHTGYSYLHTHTHTHTHTHALSHVYTHACVCSRGGLALCVFKKYTFKILSISKKHE